MALKQSYKNEKDSSYNQLESFSVLIYVLTSLLVNSIMMTRKLVNSVFGGSIMNRDEILKASRKENKNKDLAEIEVMLRAGSHAGRVGALACCLISLLSSMLAHIMLYSPWIIYFSIVATQWFVRFIGMKRKSDLAVAILFMCLTVLALLGFVRRLLEVTV